MAEILPVRVIGTFELVLQSCESQVGIPSALSFQEQAGPINAAGWPQRHELTGLFEKLKSALELAFRLGTKRPPKLPGKLEAE